MCSVVRDGQIRGSYIICAVWSEIDRYEGAILYVQCGCVALDDHITTQFREQRLVSGV
jgi:hypothetical protein